MTKIVRLDEGTLVDIVRETLNEMNKQDFMISTTDSPVPQLDHTYRAFAIGDIVCNRKTVLNKESNTNSGVLLYNKIVGIDGDKLILDDGRKISKTTKNLLCTDVWYRIFDSMGLKPSEERGRLVFDYQFIDGDVWVVVEHFPRFNATFRDRYRYRDVKRSHSGEPLRPVKMDIRETQKNIGFWLKKNDTIPYKTKNPTPDLTEVPREWILFMGGASGEKFGTWNFEKANEIVAAIPWLATTPAAWSVPRYGKPDFTDQNKRQTNCTPSTYQTNAAIPNTERKIKS